MNRFSIPTQVNGGIRLFAWLSFISELVIIVTGGAVRLTGSGLGCPTWPLCTPESLVPTPEMGIHGVIEFSNRMMSGVVGIIAVIMLLLVLRLRKERRELWTLSLILLIGVVAQAIVGGISVLTGLNPFIVGFHYTVSLVMCAIAAALLVRVYATPGPRELAVPRWFMIVTHVTTLFVALTIAMGVLTTASGPHSGDLNAARTGFNAELFEHLHAWPAYATFALTVTLAIASIGFTGTTVHRWVLALLGVEVVQIAIGLIQANTGLPEALVAAHMLLAALLASAMTVVVLHLKKPVAPGAVSPAGEMAATSA
ncbi:COX15/CtaA family protein [Microterricola viridarii]|uniref:Cytochrome c oxidase assembly protein subunit 15 n=1 Tax=Microterricola viridarii TaxID=412690 RepID=A0A1H1UBD2_9MICO|nr:COX15/CtaA family protein [Microterricola viridarii]SDS69792.1 cytochrome c oxidase assembly protein subunit 15 [Microterricola viridarii]